MDVLQYREGALACSWLTLGFTDVAFIYTLASESQAPIGLILALILAMNAVVGLTGMYICLQFK